ncbi:BCD family MFS transporter [Pantanalinema sp. GBBB05]|uniref:BCD family MFS transporter n=1 Tax=Pantanalinema sp. GBBB05 TaxID=2604139 RepID=UPI001DC8FE63|nr:BCD family MFS transporter [Pantanalinema sp. GBBB05]
METGDFSNSPIEEPVEPPVTPYQLPRITLPIMLRLGLFQLGLGMMSVLLTGLLNRVMIKELGVPATIASIVLAVTLFVSPLRVWFGHLSDRKPLWGKLHRTSYVLTGAIGFAILAYLAVQVMWQLGAVSRTAGWGSSAYGWTIALAAVFGLYGIALSSSSTPFATLLVDVTDEDDRAKLVGIDWAMLTGGIAIGGILIKVLLKRLETDPSGAALQASVNNVFIIMPLLVVVLAFIATWGIEQKYSRFMHHRQVLANANESITLARSWHILTASRQTRFFFSFLLAMTLGLFLQDTILEPYGGEVFKMPPGDTAILNSFFGGGALLGILGAGFWVAPRIGKRQTAKVGCQLVVLSIILIIGSGFTSNVNFLQLALLLFGIASGVTTTGAVTLMLDLTATETAGMFIGAWGLSQALARGCATVAGGALLDIAKRLTTDQVAAYGFVFILQAVAMLIAIGLLGRVNVQEFQAKSKEAIAAVMGSELE